MQNNKVKRSAFVCLSDTASLNTPELTFRRRNLWPFVDLWPQTNDLSLERISAYVFLPLFEEGTGAIRNYFNEIVINYCSRWISSIKEKKIRKKIRY